MTLFYFIAALFFAFILGAFTTLRALNKTILDKTDYLKKANKAMEKVRRIQMREIRRYTEQK